MLDDMREKLCEKKEETHQYNNFNIQEIKNITFLSKFHATEKNNFCGS
jgi:hypothetical protein